MTRLLTGLFAWTAIYVTATTSLLGFQQAGLNIPLPVQTFLLTAVLVPMMIFILGPLAATLAQAVIQKFG